jgi:hypothetical protein
MKTLHFTFLILLFLTACSGSQTERELPTLVAISTSVASPVFATTAPTNSPSLTLATPLPITSSPSAQITQGIAGTPTATFTPSRTITNTPTPTFTLTLAPTREPGGLDFLVTLAAQATILPPTYYAPFGGTSVATGIALPTPANATITCPATPTGGFGTLFTTDPSIRQQLGCPVSSTNVQLNAATQNFEFGFMVWMAGTPGYIYAFYPNGTYTRFLDTFVEGVDPVSTGALPPNPNVYEPVRGFGKVWRTFPEVQTTLGWATGGEGSGLATILDFQSGRLLHVSTRGDILVLTQNPNTDSGTWRSAPGSP